jgi:hypothetical protein
MKPKKTLIQVELDLAIMAKELQDFTVGMRPWELEYGKGGKKGGGKGGKRGGERGEA